MKEEVFHKFDMETWERREHFLYYQNILSTNYTVNMPLDVTSFLKVEKECGRRFYPSMLYVIMRAVNDRPAFRMAVDDEGAPGYYEVCHPTYTIFHRDDKTFSDIWSEWDRDYTIFYDRVVRDMEDYADIKGVKTKPGRPAACVPISDVPWISFTGVSHDTPGPRNMFFPIIVFGKYYESGGRYLLPFSMMINHAAADGYHTSMFFADMQKYCDTAAQWMK